jgi:hypothetical protein
MVSFLSRCPITRNGQGNFAGALKNGLDPDVRHATMHQDRSGRSCESEMRANQGEYEYQFNARNLKEKRSKLTQACPRNG